MASYILKNVSANQWNIFLARKQIGFVRRTENGFTARIGELVATGATHSEAFREVTAIRNRISICGENDREKAIEAIRERNERVLADYEKRLEELAPILYPTSRSVNLGSLHLRPTIRKRLVHV